MSLTPSNMMPLNFTAPDFLLPDTRNKQMTDLKTTQGELATVVMFSCNHCPFVIHIQKCFVKIAKHYQSQGVGFVAISSNDAQAYPDDTPEKMALFAKEYNFTFPYLYDESQATARSFNAACTPDLFVFDAELMCVYHGRFDDSTPGKTNPVTGQELCAALEALIQNEPVNPIQIPSMGCNIKWKQVG